MDTNGSSGPLATADSSHAVAGPFRSKLRRKRHDPVGPAGIWFQTQRQNRKKGKSLGMAPSATLMRMRKGTLSPTEQFKGEEQEEEEDHTLPPHMGSHKGSMRDDGSIVRPDAWVLMQYDLKLPIPALPHFVPAAERRAVLRRFMPPGFVLLPDLMENASLDVTPQCKLLVVVEKIQSLTDNLWTVEVTDETGSKMAGWIQPKLVRQEQQRQQPKFVRAGVVWMLTSPVIILVNRDGSRNGACRDDLERMLLVSEHNIERVWTKEQAAKVSQDDFKNWFEQRSTVNLQALEFVSTSTQTVASEDEEFTCEGGPSEMNQSPSREETLHTITAHPLTSPSQDIGTGRGDVCNNDETLLVESEGSRGMQQNLSQAGRLYPVAALPVDTLSRPIESGSRDLSAIEMTRNQSASQRIPRLPTTNDTDASVNGAVGSGLTPKPTQNGSDNAAHSVAERDRNSSKTRSRKRHKRGSNVKSRSPKPKSILFTTIDPSLMDTMFNSDSETETAAKGRSQAAAEIGETVTPSPKEEQPSLFQTALFSEMDISDSEE